MEAPKPEEEIKILKETNNELVQKVQYLKEKASQCEKDKLYLMKENNDLRLKLTRLQSTGEAQAQALDAGLQSSSEEALSHLVQASNAIARSIELAKSYMRDRQDLELSSLRWSSIGGSPTPAVREKVHKVAPMMMGGRSIQPFVSLDRIPLNSGGALLVNQNPTATDRVLPLPMHILQDVYIPLRRIDASEFLNNSSQEVQNQENDSNTQETEDQHETSRRESERISEAREYNDSVLNVINEESEMEDSNADNSSRSLENPLEGPSWLLDLPRGRPREVKFEPDSTTEVDESISNIDNLRGTANQSQSQSPILEPQRPNRSPENGRGRAIAGCSQMRSDRILETSSNSITPETRSSTSRHPSGRSTPKSTVTVRRRSPQCGVMKEAPGFGDESQDLGNQSGADGSMATPALMTVGCGNESTPSLQQLAFTPTVRRKRTSPFQPLPTENTPTPPTLVRDTKAKRNRKNSRNSSSNRILKVLVPKIDIEALENSNSCDSRDNGNTSDLETSNTDNITKRLEIKISRSQLYLSKSAIDERVASTSGIRPSTSEISPSASEIAQNTSEIVLNTSERLPNTSENLPNIRDIASTSGVNRISDIIQSTAVKKKGKGRRSNLRGVKERSNGSGDASPAKRRAMCKSPSPNGSTNTTDDQESEQRPSTNMSGSSAGSDLEGNGLRTRRTKKLVTYKEKPLNVKLRRH